MPTASVDGGAWHTDMLAPRTPPSSLLVAVLAAPAEQVAAPADLLLPLTIFAGILLYM